MQALNSVQSRRGLRRGINAYSSRDINGRNGRRGRREEEGVGKWGLLVSGKRVREGSTGQSLCGSVNRCEPFSFGKESWAGSGLSLIHI